MSPSPHREDLTRGYVIPIGGAEERTGSMRVLRRFARLMRRAQSTHRDYSDGV